MSLKSERKKTQSAMVRYSSSKLSLRMVRDGVGHGETSFLGTVKNPELDMLEMMIWFWSRVSSFGNESMSAVAELPRRMQRAPFHRERDPILTALSCTGDVPEGSCPPAKHLLLRLQVHLSLCALSAPTPHPQLSPAPLQCQRGSSACQVSREDQEDNFSHVDVWRCQYLSVSMSLAFITTSLFPGTSHLVPSARCRGSCSDCRVCARIRSLLFTLVAHFSSFLPAGFSGSSPFWPVFTLLCPIQPLSTSSHCYFLASCVNTGKNSVSKRRAKVSSGFWGGA